MSDPRRLIHGSDPASRALLRAAVADGPSSRSRRVAAAALGLGPLVVVTAATSSGAAAAAAGAGGVAAGGGAATAGGAALTAMSLGKWIAVVAVLGAASAGAVGVAGVVGTGGLLGESPRALHVRPRADAPAAMHAAPPPGAVPRERRPELPSPEAAATSLPRAATPPPFPRPTPIAPRPARAAPRVASPPEPSPVASTTAPPPRPASRLLAETARLEEARAALDARDPAGAITALDDYARAFPLGALAPEATVLRVEALAGTGDRASAQRLADRFLLDHPASPLAARVRSFVRGPSIP